MHYSVEYQTIEEGAFQFRHLVQNHVCFSNAISRLARRWNRFLRMKCLVYIKTKEFYWAVMIMVAVNTLAIATEHHHQPYSLTILQGLSPPA